MRKVKKESKIIIACLIVLVVLGMITFCFLSGAFKSKEKEISYKQQSEVTYNVCLKENNYFEEKCLGENQKYVAAIIDYININFKYIMNYSDIVENNYSYEVVANVSATSKEDTSKVLYNKSETLVKETKVNKKDTTALINENLKIDYDKYNSIITSFKKDYVLALDSKLTITLNLKYKATAGKNFKNIDETKKISIVIPLGEQTISILNEGNNYTNNNTLNKEIAKENHNEKYIVHFLIGLDGLMVIVLIFFFIKLFPEKKEYEKKLDKILKQYDQAIVVLNRMPDISTYTLMEITTFEEMLDARDNLEKPILFYREENRDISYFIIMNNNEAYVYVLKSDN